MKDFFKDTLPKSDLILGSYDDSKGLFNLTLDGQTVSFDEKVNGWVSFKSYTPEFSLSCANRYYTFKEGGLYKHHDETVDRNTFYGDYTNSSIDVVLNDAPSDIKTFHTLNYEGSQSKVNEFKETQLILPGQPDTDYSDQEFYNLTEKDGW